MFMVNDKGSSWAYASPSFGSSLRPDHLKHMRELADLPHTPKHLTEVRHTQGGFERSAFHRACARRVPQPLALGRPTDSNQWVTPPPPVPWEVSWGSSPFTQFMPHA